MTTEEFAKLVVDCLEITNHFKRGEPAHPEDLVIAFVTQAEAIAIGAGATGKKVWAAEKKAVMQTGTLRKNALPQDDEIAPAILEDENSLGYSEWKNNGGYL